MNQKVKTKNLSWKLQRENHQFKLINKMNLQNCFICLLHKGCNNTLGFYLLQQTRMLQHIGFLPATTDNDATIPYFSVCYSKQGFYNTWFSIYYYRQGFYNTLCRLIACPSATLPPWTNFYQSDIHFLDSVIRNHRDKLFS